VTVYVIVQLKMTDRAAHGRYQARFFDAFRKFGGRLPSADKRSIRSNGGKKSRPAAARARFQFQTRLRPKRSHQ
jgi:uncharacterized protein (DUF1330 family)